MKEKGSDTFNGFVLKGLAALFLDSKAIIRSTHPAGLLTLKVSMKSWPNTSTNSFSNSKSTPDEMEDYEKVLAVILVKLFINYCYYYY